jgi:hypothetical protein
MGDQPGGQVVQFPFLAESGAEDDVERINQYSMYEFGQRLEKLRRYPEEPLIKDMFPDLLAASGALDSLAKGDPFPIEVSKSQAKELENVIDGIIRDNFFTQNEQGERKFKAPAEDARLDSWDWKHLNKTLEKFETIFAEEMRENATYFVPRRGIFNTKALVDSADEAFPKDLLPFIPDKTKQDWKAAGRCLAFNLLSASGFHVARAVEGTLETYYQRFCGAQAGTTLKSWNDYIVALNGARTSGVTPAPSEKIIAEIQQMKDDYRNPIAHPRAVLSEGDARMLFANGESVIIGMAQELAAASAGVQPNLSLVVTQSP